MENQNRLRYKRLVFKPQITLRNPPKIDQPICQHRPIEKGDNLYYMLVDIEGPYLDGNGGQYYLLKVVPLPMEEYKRGIKAQRYLTAYMVWDREIQEGGLIDYQSVPKRLKSRMQLLMEQVI